MRGLSRHGIVDIYIKLQMLLLRDNETTNEESGLATLDLVYSERLSRSSRVAPAGIVFALFGPGFDSHLGRYYRVGTFFYFFEFR